MSDDIAYRHYWARKRLLAADVPHFPIARWWPTDDLCEVETLYFNEIRNARALLDFGAGDLRMMKKLQRAGFAGRYDTLDIGGEYPHTYSHISQVGANRYDAILCLDVIEHMSLTEGLTLLQALVGLLEPGGALLVQTPNARCVRSPLGWDMTHVQCYNAGDLWAHLRTMGMDSKCYRVSFERTGRDGFVRKLHRAAARYVIARMLGADYADNLAVIARRAGMPAAPEVRT